jgi:hypothetical protein
MVVIVMSGNDKQAAGRSKQVGRGWEAKTGHQWGSGAMGNSELADGADKVASGGGGVDDDGAFRKPIQRRAMGVNSSVKREDIRGGVQARDGDDKDTERVGFGKQLDSLEGAKQSRQGSSRQMSKTGSWEGDVNVVKRWQKEVAWRHPWSRGSSMARRTDG